MSQYKTCTKCRQIKAITEFHKHKRSADGLRARCKPCHSADTELWRVNNLQKANATRKKWVEANKDKSDQIKRNYWKNNPKKVAESNRKWQQANKDHIRAVAKKWTQENRHLVNERAARRRAKIKQNPIYYVLPRDLKRLYKSACHYCNSIESIELDHVISVDYGGSHGIGNFLPACRSCNASKGEKTIMEWLLRGNPPTAYAQLRGFQPVIQGLACATLEELDVCSVSQCTV